MLFAKGFVNADIRRIFLPAGAAERTCTARHAIDILRIAAHVPAHRSEIPQRLVAVRTARKRQRIVVLMPGPRRKIERTVHPLGTLARDDIDDTARRVRAVNRGAGAFDDLDLIHALNADHLVEVDPCGLAARQAVLADARARQIVHAAPVDEDDHAGVAVDEHAVVVELIAVLAAAVAGILKRHPRDALDRLCEIEIVPLFNLLARDDLHIPARPIVRLFRHRIAELVDGLLRLNHNGVKCIEG